MFLAVSIWLKIMYISLEISELLFGLSMHSILAQFCLILVGLYNTDLLTRVKNIEYENMIYRVTGLSCPEAGGCKSAILRGFPNVFSLFGPCKVGEISFRYSWTTGIKKSYFGYLSVFKIEGELSEIIDPKVGNPQN